MLTVETRARKQRRSWVRNQGLLFLLLAPTFVTLVCVSGRAQTNVPNAHLPSSRPLLVGYLPAYKGTGVAAFVAGLDFTRMTHLNLAFGNPPKCDDICTIKSDMNFSLSGQTDADIDAIVTAAHAAGLKVLLSIGGGGGDQRIIQFYNAGLSAPLIASLDRFLRTHKLDGVDVDIEDPSNMGAPFAAFVSALTSTFHPENKLVTAAVAKYLQDSMPDSALHQFDFINVMNYSNYASAVTALQFYAQNKKVPQNQIVLGVPFFASTSDASKEEDYSTILTAYPNAWKVDMVGGGPLDNGQAFSYLGESTMAKEVQLGKQYGGIMIWQMMGDAPAPHALLKVIEQELETPTLHIKCPCTNAR